RESKTRRIPYLELALLSAMGGRLVFHKNGRPRFELSPMKLYAQLKSDMPDNIHSVPESASEPDGWFRLPDGVCAEIRENCGAEVFYAGAVDTENRAIRILFFPKGDDGVAHMQFSAQRMTTEVVGRILHHMAEANANVIRFQVRRGLNAKQDQAL